MSTVPAFTCPPSILETFLDNTPLQLGIEAPHRPAMAVLEKRLLSALPAGMRPTYLEFDSLHGALLIDSISAAIAYGMSVFAR